jgi:vacuolar-type H+-ATPase subunit I/STV1
MELTSSLGGGIAPEAYQLALPADVVLDFERAHYEDSPWFRTSTWLAIAITFGSTVMVLSFVAQGADALTIVQRTLFPIIFTLCFVLFSFGIFANLAKDLWGEGRALRYVNRFLMFFACLTTVGMLVLAAMIYVSFTDWFIAMLMIGSAAGVFVVYALFCLWARFKGPRKYSPFESA